VVVVVVVFVAAVMNENTPEGIEFGGASEDRVEERERECPGRSINCEEC